MSYDSDNDGTVCDADPCNPDSSADVAKCCKDSTKAKCSSIGADTTARNNWCGTGKEFDDINANEVCAAKPCSSNTPSDVALCCIDPNKAKCRTIATTPANFCQTTTDGGKGAADKFYNHIKANADCAAGSCSSSTQADIDMCCTTGTRAPCSSIAPSPPSAAESFCNTGAGTASMLYKTSNPGTCAASACNSGRSADIAACCAAKAKCSTLVHSTGASAGTLINANSCGTGASAKVYNPAADDTDCAGLTCTATDINTCCAAKAKCSSIGAGAADQNAARATFCGTATPPKVYNTDDDDTDCAGLTCTTATDVNTCCTNGETVSGRLDVKQEALLQDAVLGQGGGGHS